MESKEFYRVKGLREVGLEFYIVRSVLGLVQAYKAKPRFGNLITRADALVYPAMVTFEQSELGVAVKSLPLNDVSRSVDRLFHPVV